MGEIVEYYEKKNADIEWNKYTIFKDAKDIYEGYKRCNRTSKR